MRLYLFVCVWIFRCLLLLQGLDGAKGDKVSLPFCLDEGIWRGLNKKGVEQMVIARDGSVRTHIHKQAYTPAPGPWIK